jgi:pimeloyl-ACP methyl ester carboxylesterase
LLTRHRAGLGPPLVLLHGLGLSWRSWRPILPALERRHDVVALDLPGFGDSKPLATAEPPTVAALLAAVERELDRLGLDRPAIVGNSLGGWLALELARRGRASRVVGIAPAGLELPAERVYVALLNELMRARAKLGRRLGPTLARTLPARLALLTGLRTRAWRVPIEDVWLEVRDFAGAPAFQATLARAEGLDVPVGLPAVSVPVRILFGTADIMLGAFTAPRFAALMPGVDLVPLVGLGHVPMADDPALVARRILEFTAD